MNTGSRDLKQAKRIAQDLANMNGVPYSVFVPHMPSVYSVGRTPLFVERPPAWWDNNLAGWAAQQEQQGAIVMWPKKL